MIEQFRMDGRVAIVTGGTSGIGLAIGKALAGAGARVVLSGRSQERGDEALEAFQADESGRDFHPCDVADASAVSALVEEVVSSHGGLHVLVNSAAINIVKPALDHTPDDLDALLASNVRGAFLCAQEAARAMVNRGGGGKIVFLTSMVAERAVPNQSAYVATKGAIVSLDARACARMGAARDSGERPGAATHQNADDGGVVRQSRKDGGSFCANARGSRGLAGGFDGSSALPVLLGFRLPHRTAHHRGRRPRRRGVMLILPPSLEEGGAFIRYASSKSRQHSRSPTLLLSAE